MQKQTKKAFTLVELIVVITILAILGTIAFISLQGYSKSARDSRRISDVNNVKTSLELFILNAGKYPLPDEGEEVGYSGETLWTQGIIGDVVTRNLSKNLQKKPLDPLLETEYIYSVANNNKEFEVLGFYEGTTAYNNVSNTVKAANTYTPKINGTYNGVFLKTSSTIVPTPSIITSEDLSSGGLTLNATNIQSQVISGGENFPDINNQLSIGNLDINLSTAAVITDDSSDDAKLLAIEAIQNAYSGTSLASNYEYILSKTEESDKLDLVETVILNNNASITSNTNSESEESTLTGNDEYTKLLLHMDGSDNGTTFTDSSSGSHTITPKYNNTWTFTRPDGDDISESFTKYITGNADINISSNKLRLTANSDSTNSNAGVIYSNFDISGNFEIQVDFDVINLGNLTTGNNYFGLYVRGDTNNYLNFRVKKGTTQHIYQMTRRYNGNYEVVSFADTNDLSGKLKIKRIGSSWTCSYWNGTNDWIDIATASLWNIDVTQIQLTSTSYISDDDLIVDYDNFQINSADTIINPPSVLTQTSEKKISTASAYFGGDVSYLEIPDSDDWDFEDDDFTIDTWVYAEDSSAAKTIIQQGAAAGSVRSWWLRFAHDNAGKISFDWSSDGTWQSKRITDTDNLSLNTWNHIAVVRNNDVIKLYINGIEKASSSITGVLYNTSKNLRIGKSEDEAFDHWNGYIDELRISKGIARWTENFTPPSGPYGE